MKRIALPTGLLLVVMLTCLAMLRAQDEPAKPILADDPPVPTLSDPLQPPSPDLLAPPILPNVDPVQPPASDDPFSTAKPTLSPSVPLPQIGSTPRLPVTTMRRRRSEQAASELDPVTVSTLKIVSLRTLQAKDAVTILQQVFNNGRPYYEIAADERSNSVILRGREEDLQELIALLEQLDSAESPEPKRTQTRRPRSDDEVRLEKQALSLKAQLDEEAAKSADSKSTDNDARVKELIQQIRSAVDESFNERQRQQLAEIEELTIRLNKLAKAVREREEKREAIIEQRIDALLRNSAVSRLETPSEPGPGEPDTILTLIQGTGYTFSLGLSDVGFALAPDFDPTVVTAELTNTKLSDITVGDKSMPGWSIDISGKSPGETTVTYASADKYDEPRRIKVTVLDAMATQRSKPGNQSATNSSATNDETGGMRSGSVMGLPGMGGVEMGDFRPSAIPNPATTYEGTIDFDGQSQGLNLVDLAEKVHSLRKSIASELDGIELLKQRLSTFEENPDNVRKGADTGLSNLLTKVTAALQQKRAELTTYKQLLSIEIDAAQGEHFRTTQELNRVRLLHEKGAVPTRQVLDADGAAAKSNTALVRLKVLMELIQNIEQEATPTETELPASESKRDDLAPKVDEENFNRGL